MEKVQRKVRITILRGFILEVLNLMEKFSGFRRSNCILTRGLLMKEVSSTERAN